MRRRARAASPPWRPGRRRARSISASPWPASSSRHPASASAPRIEGPETRIRSSPSNDHELDRWLFRDHLGGDLPTGIRRRRNSGRRDLADCRGGDLGWGSPCERGWSRRRGRGDDRRGDRAGDRGRALGIGAGAGLAAVGAGAATGARELGGARACRSAARGRRLRASAEGAGAAGPPSAAGLGFAFDGRPCGPGSSSASGPRRPPCRASAWNSRGRTVLLVLPRGRGPRRTITSDSKVRSLVVDGQGEAVAEEVVVAGRRRRRRSARRRGVLDSLSTTWRITSATVWPAGVSRSRAWAVVAFQARSWASRPSYSR